MILSKNEELIPAAVPVINAEILAFLGIENLNTSGESSSDEVIAMIETEYMKLQLMKTVTF